MLLGVQLTNATTPPCYYFDKISNNEGAPLLHLNFAPISK